MDRIIEHSATRIFTDNSNDPAALWSALEESELTSAWIPQSMGGAGLSISDVFGLIRISGSALTPVPFAETLLASHLLSAAGLQTPGGPGSVAVTTDAALNKISPDSIVVPFGNDADYVVALTSDNCVSLFVTTEMEPIDSVGNDPLYKLSLKTTNADSTAALPDSLSVETFNQTGALVRAAQMCGAMDAILDLTLTHTSTREQFGRPLGKFQAIQHLLAEIAGEAGPPTCRRVGLGA